MKNKIFKAWAVHVKEIEGDPAFVDFISLDKDKCERHAEDTWDRDVYEIRQCEVFYTYD